MIAEVNWENLEAAKAHPDFAGQGWLTFYLMGQPENHRSSWPDFRELGAANLRGEEGGFVYAKFPVALNKNDIGAILERVLQLYSQAELDCSIVDIDASPDVERSKFFTLWTAS
ncbi:hypothetical protein [Altererythrobacter sp.]|uniref:hypothetical protein n=1 Tax=Altererythrobacter sp. TaxID=1872480 RepID=UPI001B2BD9B1|nr:hypothetical protein [Altererythrobacter sp.]MBO6609138.1 hypothetical protein [Altererythrobacter sp.]MBO6641335.1 hypothetical protein [Altererythrobacter sp.]MBO6707967.1 hypothetical protein [Altererythrobacter sp.]